MSALGRVYSAVRNNWRIVLLAVLIIVATYFLFVPGAPLGDDVGGYQAEQGLDQLTNLQFGIDLAGGSRVIAPVHGYHVDGIAFESLDEASALESDIADALNLSAADIRVDFDAGTVEVFDPAIDADTFENALVAAGLVAGDFDGPHSGVTSTTRSDIIDVLNSRLDAAGFAGGSVTEQTLADGEAYISAEWPGSRDELREAMADRGAVQVIAHTEDGDGWQELAVLDTQDDIASVDAIRTVEDGYEVPITVTSGHAPEFVDRLLSVGFDDPRASTVGCSYPNDEQPQERPEEGWGYCLLVVQDGEIVSGYGVRENLRSSFEDGTFVDDPRFVINTIDRADAEQVRLNLQEGALPAQLNLAEATEMEVSPALAERFLQNSLLTGLVAIIAVVVMVFLRYGDPRIAAPMSVTALSELYLLLGFAAAIGMSLDLAVMAGFIAVVGTGVDDLIIIADEVMGRHDVRSQRVFDSRFRKAFWVIGAAAATTILAMSPLAIFQLGDLRGFAIVTILGVLIGVLLTRPAYGNILRLIKTDK